MVYKRNKKNEKYIIEFRLQKKIFILIKKNYYLKNE